MAEFADQYESVLDLLDTGVIRLAPDGRVDMMNTAAEQALMMSRDRAIGLPVAELNEIPEAVREAVGHADGRDSSLCLRELRTAGGLFDCTVRSTRQGYCLLEIHNLEWEQNRRRMQQREIQTGMLELLSRNLGHEVRNPLGGIRGAAQMLADELHSEELETLARLIMRESDRIDELIRRFGQPDLQKSRCDLYKLIQEALDLVQAEFAEVHFDRDYDPSIPPVDVDAGAIRQVMLNLLKNACQAGAKRVRIRTRIKHDTAFLRAGQASAIRLDVDDDGSGVPPSLHSLLFLPLVTGRRDGTGLGLSLSQQIASAHDGVLTFEPLQPGSRFSLFLPLDGKS